MISEVGLTPTQRSILECLAGIRPAPTLFGGAAIIVAYTAHRQTRDLDLKWSETDDLAPLVPEVLDRLRALGHRVDVQRRFATFIRLLVDGPQQVVVDLVAEPAAEVAQLVSIDIDGKQWRIPSMTDALADKLCALMSRAELRDLGDVRELLMAGADLDAAIERAPLRDAGFSPYVLAWVLESFPLQELADGANLDAETLGDLATARQALQERLVALADLDAFGSSTET